MTKLLITAGLLFILTVTGSAQVAQGGNYTLNQSVIASGGGQNAAYLIGSNLIGLLNDKFGATANPAMMRYSLLVCPIACFWSAICLFAGGKSLQKSEIRQKIVT